MFHSLQMQITANGQDFYQEVPFGENIGSYRIAKY
jgi:hypothetical protein